MELNNLTIIVIGLLFALGVALEVHKVYHQQMRSNFGIQEGITVAISEAKIKIVIDNYFKKECDINTSIREAFEKGFRVGVLKGMEAQSKSIDNSVPLDVLCEWFSANECSPSCNICERYYKDGLCVRSDVQCGSREHWQDILTDWRSEQKDG